MFGLIVVIGGPSEALPEAAHQRETPDHAITDVSVVLLGNLRSCALDAEAPELPAVTRAARPIGLVVDTIAGTHGPCWRLWFGRSGACCDYILSADCRTLWARWNERVDEAAVVRLLFDTVLAWTARLQGKLCLHASAAASVSTSTAASDGHAIAVLAPSGSGKSTIASALARWAEWRVLSDDTAVVTPDDQGHVVHPGRPYLRLDSASVAAVAAPRHDVVLDEDKYRVIAHGTNEHDVETAARRLTAMYVLRRECGIARPEIRPCSLADAAGLVTANLYPPALPRDHERQRHDHALVTRLLHDVPCRMLTIPNALTELPAVCETLIHDVRMLRPDQAGHMATSFSIPAIT